jgi:uncharacterized protein (TIGR03435 family)
MKTFSSVVVVATFLSAVSLSAQTTAPSNTPQQAFEVASIKANNSGAQSASFGAQPGGRIVVVNNSLRNIIRNVWNVQNYQIVGGPDWVNVDRWDITAKVPEGVPTQPLIVMQMMRPLLADRFKLVVHNETREMPVYALVLARTDGKFGPQMKRSESNCAAIAEANRRGEPAPERSPDAPFCGTRSSPGAITTSGVLMADFARNLSNAAGRVTVDRTGLTGGFDLQLKFSPDPLGPNVGDPASDLPSLFAAIQEQLGLKLEAQRAPIEMLVIDSAQRATEN